MTIDQLSGRQLDIAVAGQVFGHRVEERPNSGTARPLVGEVPEENPKRRADLVAAFVVSGEL